MKQRCERQLRTRRASHPSFRPDIHTQSPVLTVRARPVYLRVRINTSDRPEGSRCQRAGARSVLTGFSRTAPTRDPHQLELRQSPASCCTGRTSPPSDPKPPLCPSLGRKRAVCPPVVFVMAATSSSSELMARLLPSVPFPFSSSSAASVRSKQLFGERQALAEIKQEATSSYVFATPDRKTGFRFESLATEFENTEENDSGIGGFNSFFMRWECQKTFRQLSGEHVQAFLLSAPTFVPPIEPLSLSTFGPTIRIFTRRPSKLPSDSHVPPSSGSSHRVRALCTHHLFSISIPILPTAILTPANSC